jgi:hypothetical protein
MKNTTTPGAELRAVYDAYITAAYALSDARRQRVWPAIWKADMDMTIAVEKFHALKDATRNAFAKSRGWRYDRKRYVRVAEYGACGRRIIKRPEFFRDAEGAHVGLITHSAATLEEISAYAARHGYNAELLPFSWSVPAACVEHNAVLFTLKAGAKWP